LAVVPSLTAQEIQAIRYLNIIMSSMSIKSSSIPLEWRITSLVAEIEK